MKIDTKFNHGDKVGVMRDNKPYQFQIYKICIEIMDFQKVYEIYIDYIPGETFLDKDREYRYYDYECFATKKELLNSFLKDDE